MIALCMIWIRKNSPSWLSYLYFLRFSLLMWLTLPLLIVLDACNISTSVTRVLLTMSDAWQAMYSASAIVLLGWSAMLLARIVIVYGKERFDIAAPASLSVEPGKMGFKILIWSQIPGASLLLYILWLSLCDAENGGEPSRLFNVFSVERLQIFGGMLIGILFAVLIWFVISWIYYLLHASSPGAEEIWEFTLPYSPDGNNPISSLTKRVMEAAKTQKSPTESKAPNTGVAQKLGKGYSSSDGNGLGSGHSLAAAVVLGLSLLYFLVAYISFPLPGLGRDFASVHGLLGAVRWLLSWSDFTHRWLGRHLGGLWIGFAAFVVSGVLLMTYLRVRTRKPNRGAPYLLGWIVSGLIWLFVARAPHYPALATIITLLILTASVLAGLSFFLDRFRVPAALLLMAILFSYKRLLPTDHVYETPRPAVLSVTAALSPRQLADAFVSERAKDSSGDGPIIVITATGGGIHAAYWTATVLDGLEAAFKTKDVTRPLEKSILLMSSASGGSVAMGNWIENHAQYGDAPSVVGRQPLHEAANQPALEAVAWGLLHTDLWRMLFPFGKFSHDRAWFLEQANLAGLYVTNHPPQTGESLDDEEIDEHWNSVRTLAELKPQFASSGGSSVPHIPAFSLNASVVETGERFLLSNYVPSQLGPPVGDPLAILPWHSALSFFRQYPQQDLRISTAARLSANFPYVSPVARADVEGLCTNNGGNPRCGTFHLADGGYYDNDGVSSAIEFLWLAFGEAAPPYDSKTPMKRVLLIQIRDSPLPAETKDLAANFENSSSKKREISQVLAPVTTVYNSWHVSETTRNQRELSALQAALPGVNLRTVAFSFPGNPVSRLWPSKSPGNTTLNWRLTREDQNEIRNQWRVQSVCAVAVAAWSDASTAQEQEQTEKSVRNDCGTMGSDN